MNNLNIDTWNPKVITLKLTKKQIEAINQAVIMLEAYAPIDYQDSYLFDILIDLQFNINRDAIKVITYE